MVRLTPGIRRALCAIALVWYRRRSAARPLSKEPGDDMQAHARVRSVRFGLLGLAALASALSSPVQSADTQVCPDKNLVYWQAFPAGGESDISARHQQAVL